MEKEREISIGENVTNLKERNKINQDTTNSFRKVIMP